MKKTKKGRPPARFRILAVFASGRGCVVKASFPDHRGACSFALGMAACGPRTRGGGAE